MLVKNLENLNKNKVSAGKNTYIQILIGPDEGPNFALRKFTIEPGGSMPKHSNLVEHEQFVLNGRAKIGIGEQIFEVKQNNIVFIPAGTPHWYETLGSEPFEFLCIVPNKEDKIEILKK
ncbi:MAG: cupin [Candidatus Schekmanbacteria bacterium RBG_13_48_7]|uniref:Cupin n=1 Tax=Candidatus Schekmanbacteria bacterium RBG_13_48_7 TaxID=1817878 RepID=A0A1F7RRH0_9BACT|nr:MAG: cupin [Candidatus Schekmanbacteria bacterium RBG_13_48_7]